MSTIQRVNTSNVVPSKRLSYWNDKVTSIYTGMSIDSSVGDFSANMLKVNVGRISVMRARSDESIVRRNSFSTVPHEGEGIKLHLQNQGASVNRQAGREALLRVGELTVCENRSSYRIEPSRSCDMFALELPYELAKAHIPDVFGQVMQRISACTLHGRLLFNMLHTIHDECAATQEDEIEFDNLEVVLLELLKSVLSGPSEVAGGMEHRKNRQLEERLKAIVQRHLTDAGLNTELLANEAGMSTRRVQLLFAELGTTPTIYIRDQRLRRAAERLQFEPDTPVTGIAHDVGFSDSAYFTRCFRQRYGESPKRYRTRSFS